MSYDHDERQLCFQLDLNQPNVNQPNVNQRKRTHVMMLRQKNKTNKTNKKANKLATESCPGIPFKYQPSLSQIHLSKKKSAHMQDNYSKRKKTQQALFSNSDPAKDFGNIVKVLIAAASEYIRDEDYNMDFCELFGIEFVTV